MFFGAENALLFDISTSPFGVGSGPPLTLGPSPPLTPISHHPRFALSSPLPFATVRSRRVPMLKEQNLSQGYQIRGLGPAMAGKLPGIADHGRPSPGPGRGRPTFCPWSHLPLGFLLTRHQSQVLSNRSGRREARHEGPREGRHKGRVFARVDEGFEARSAVPTGLHRDTVQLGTKI